MMEPEVCVRVPQLVAMRNECFSTEVCISLCTRAARARFVQCLSAVARHALLSLQGSEGTRMPAGAECRRAHGAEHFQVE
jgi:hypothetical protein